MQTHMLNIWNKAWPHLATFPQCWVRGKRTLRKRRKWKTETETQKRKLGKKKNRA